MPTPSYTDCIKAKIAAQAIATNIHAVYWLEGGSSGNESTIRYLRQDAWKELERLAALFGAELVEIEPEQDETQPDADTIAARAASVAKGIVDAGRGDLLK